MSIDYDDKKIAELVVNPAIIRHKLKINSVIKNAKGFLKIQEEETKKKKIEKKPISFTQILGFLGAALFAALISIVVKIFMYTKSKHAIQLTDLFYSKI